MLSDSILKQIIGSGSKKVKIELEVIVCDEMEKEESPESPESESKGDGELGNLSWLIPRD